MTLQFDKDGTATVVPDDALRWVHAPQVWEYKVYPDDRCGILDTNVLNQLGREGWEVVGFFPGSNGHLIFKRPGQRIEV